MLKGNGGKRASTGSEYETPSPKRQRRTRSRDVDPHVSGPGDRDVSRAGEDHRNEDRASQAGSIPDKDPPKLFRHSKVAPVNMLGPFHVTDEEVMKYRTWQKAGGFHESECHICGEYVDHTRTANCITCRRSYHPGCLSPPISPSSIDSPEAEWYCEVCVTRGWHVHPPSPMTPPSSPPRPTWLPPPPSQQQEQPQPTRLKPLQQSMHATPLIQSIHAPPLQPPSSGPPSTVPFPQPFLKSATPRGPFASSTSYSSHRPPPPPPPPPPTSDPSPNPASFSHVPQPPPPSSPALSTTRRSRFSTLSPSLESALQTLYVELEASTDLRSEIAQLNTRILGLTQELRIRDNRLILAQRALEASEADLSTVRGQVKELERREGLEGGRELIGLRVENEALKGEVENLKKLVVEKEATVEEWKRKLRGLMGE